MPGRRARGAHDIHHDDAAAAAAGPTTSSPGRAHVGMFMARDPQSGAPLAALPTAVTDALIPPALRALLPHPRPHHHQHGEGEQEDQAAAAAAAAAERAAGGHKHAE